MKASLLGIIVLAITSTAAAACEDVSPLPFVAMPAVEAGPGDAAVDPGAVARCRACALDEQGACASEQAVCEGNPVCSQLIECMAELDCWRGFDTTNLPPCLDTCASRIGSGLNELIPLAGPYFTCIIVACNEPCFAVPGAADGST